MDNVIKINFNSKKKYRMILMTATFLLLIVLVMFSPLFNIKQIEIDSMEKYSQNEIFQKINFKENMNLFAFLLTNTKRAFKNDYYVKSIETRIHWPDKISIQIEERKVRGYVPYMGAYLYIDEEGYVLDVSTSFIEKLPVVVGLDFDKFNKGEILKVKNQQSFDIVVTLSQLIVKYNLSNDVIKIDVSNPNDIHAYVNFIDVSLGDISDADEKIRIMMESLKHLQKDDKGTLDITNTDPARPKRFQYLT